MNTHQSKVKHVDEAIQKLCRQARYPTSKAYRAGLHSRFLLRITGYLTSNPYKPGRPKFEAFRFGFHEAGTTEIAPYRPTLRRAGIRKP